MNKVCQEVRVEYITDELDVFSLRLVYKIRLKLNACLVFKWMLEYFQSSTKAPKSTNELQLLVHTISSMAKRESLCVCVWEGGV